MDASQTSTIEAPGLRRKIGVAWAALAWEGLWPRLVPMLAYAALFVAAAHLDLFAGLEPWTHTGLLAVLALALGGLAWWEFRDFAWPAREDAIRRLERDSGVPHRPLVAVQDRLAAGEGDPMAVALWEAHRRREVERLAGLGNKPAHPGLASARHLGAASRAGAAADRGGRERRWLARRSHDGGLHAGLSAAAAGGRQSLDRAAGLYRQAADLSRRQRSRQGPARAGRQQAGGLRRRRARPQAAAARDRRQDDRIHHRRQGQVPGRAGHHRRQADRAAGARRRTGALEAARHSRSGADHRVRPPDRPSTSGRPRSSTSPATISA